MVDSEEPLLSPEMIADGWKVFEVEGPVYGDDGRVLTRTARLRGIRKTFRLPAPPATKLRGLTSV